MMMITIIRQKCHVDAFEEILEMPGNLTSFMKKPGG